MERPHSARHPSALPSRRHSPVLSPAPMPTSLGSSRAGALLSAQSAELGGFVLGKYGKLSATTPVIGLVKLFCEERGVFLSDLGATTPDGIRCARV